MAIFSTPIKTLDDLFLHTLRDIYYAENRISETLPAMIEKASDEQLKAGLQTHLTETQQQIKRLDTMFESLGQAAKGVTCVAMDGILAEAKEVVSDVGDTAVRDAAILSAAQAVEHYEITRYGTLIALAQELGHDDCVSPLNQTLEEERATDRKLTSIAEHRVNKAAS